MGKFRKFILGLKMDLEILEKIEDNTTSKPTYLIVLSGAGSRLDAVFSPPLDLLNCKYELALASIETYRSFPNIDLLNNQLKVLVNGKWETILIPTGSYDLPDISKEIQRQIQEKGGKSNMVTLTPNMNTLKCIMTIIGAEVDLRGERSIREVLGFQPEIYKTGRNESQKVVNIIRVNSILVHCSVIGQSYLNGSPQPIIYSFFPNALVGEKIVERPNTLIYLPIALDIIPRLTCYLTDQHQKPLDLREEELTVKFHLRAR